LHVSGASLDEGEQLSNGRVELGGGHLLGGVRSQQGGAPANRLREVVGREDAGFFPAA
jgi:hypothetical protein